MLYVIGVLFMALLAAGGLAKCENNRANSLEVVIEANKATAKLLLESETAKVAAKEKADKEFSINLQRDYDESLKKLSVLNRNYAGRLHDPWSSGNCPSAKTSADTGIPQDAAAGAELSEPLGKFLRSEADRANVAAVYAAKCRDLEMKPQPIIEGTQ